MKKKIDDTNHIRALVVAFLVVFHAGMMGEVVILPGITGKSRIVSKYDIRVLNFFNKKSNHLETSFLECWRILCCFFFFTNNGRNTF